MAVITPEQRRAAAEAGDLPVMLADTQTGDSYVLIRAEVFRQMRELIEASEDRLEHEAWSALSRKARVGWSAENPF